MNPFQLALRVLRVDRRTRTSAILTAVGVAVATGLVLLLATLPFATQAREQRAQWQEPYRYAKDGKPALLVNSSKDYFDGKEIMRVDLAVTDSGAVHLPPGIDKLPVPGQAIVSPELGKLLNRTPANQLGDRFGKPVAALGEQALRYPEQLVVLVGHSPQELQGAGGEAQPGVGGRPVADFPHTEAEPDGMLTLLTGVGVVVLLVPSLVLVASSARLTAARREQRMAALRLAGATPGQVTSIVAAETGLSAGVGALAGLLLSPALYGLATFVPWAGGTWLSSDFSLPVGLIVAIVVAIPALVVLAGVLGLRRVMNTPLFADGGHQVKPLHWWRLLSLPVAGLFFLYAILTGRDSSGGQELVLVGLFLVVGSAMLVGPWVTSAVGGTFVRIWRRPSTLLAGRRLREDPRGAYRASAGIVLAVFAGSMGLTLLPSFESLAGDSSKFVDSALYVDVSPEKADAMVEQANSKLAESGVQDRAVAVPNVVVSEAADKRDESSHLAYVMACADAAKLTKVGITEKDCKPDAGLYAPYEFDTSKYMVTSSSEPDVPTKPLGSIQVGRYSTSEGTNSAYFIEPAAMPAGLRPNETTLVVRTTDADREQVRTALASVAGSSGIKSPRQHVYDQRQELDDVRRVTVIGLTAAAILAGCSAAIATAGGVMDRRRTFGALIAAGTPVRVLSRALRMEAALPSLVATIGAGVTGILVGLGLFSLASKNPITLTPWLIAPVVLGVGVALLGASVCTPALKRVAAEPLNDE
ncbi:FtsX-like permease family protein [Amycolatopsis sulphurea]|uniref:FtsX-like permease family protein n=1 Tax=Amycolatopsis sulphurea TaxID=76022 RepID=A0A2A9FAM7_9PSEU|nr:ABC transporter permease [Amycolatopsis sulphurea]PFG48394.1 FtsX-like permease family protein [Amycolatopsis sulphurea]